MAKLWKRMDRYQGWRRRKLERDFHERLAIPTACLALGLLAVPLAVGRRGVPAAKSWGVVRGVGVFLGYYLLYSSFRSFSDNGFLPHYLGLWLPNLACILLGVVLIVRAARERQSDFLDRLPALPGWAGLKSFFGKKV